MNRHYWSWPIATYLFLGGLGGGMLFLIFVFDRLTASGLLNSGYALTLSASGIAPVGVGVVEMVGIVVGLCALLFGTLLLIFELGQPKLFWRAFITKTSIIKWGAVLLTIALVFGVLWWTALTPWEWLHWTPWYGKEAFAVFCEIVAGSAGLAVTVYTGVQLSSMKSKPFWNTPALPVLFVVSALSTACAALTLCTTTTWTYFAGAEFTNPLMSMMVAPDQMVELNAQVLALVQEQAIELFHTLDIVLVFFELFVIFLYLLMMLGAGNKVANMVAKRWLIGSWAPLFWIGMILCGLVAPQIMYLAGGILSETLAPVLVLASGLLLRFMIVFTVDRRDVPGEYKYYGRLPELNEEFITKDWTKTAWY